MAGRGVVAWPPGGGYRSSEAAGCVGSPPVPLVAGNWKLFKGPAEAREFCGELARAALPAGVEVAVCPPYVSLAAAVEALAGSSIAVFAQNVHWAAEGAYTGEVSAGMLQELGVAGAIVGHSERREYFGETDESVARRVEAALAAGLRVVACVGESLEEREAGRTELVLRIQVEAIREAAGTPERLVVAYEPVWAIGTGRVASDEQIEEAHALVRSLLDVPVLYGGSVKPDNCAPIAGCRGVDGALVGGASLDVDSFAAICQAFRS
jgi:triosephosphate isomerase